jgi:hypothetical protein
MGLSHRLVRHASNDARYSINSLAFREDFLMSDFYHDSPSEFTKGQRVQLHPATYAWMSGDRYGEVTRINDVNVSVKLDKSGRIVRVAPSLLAIVED